MPKESTLAAPNSPLIRNHNQSDLRNPHTLLVLSFALVTRLLYLVALKPMWTPDSVTYTTACSLWATHFFTDGARTPMYPLLLGLVQTLAGVPAISSLHPAAGYILVAVQSLLGVISCLLVYSCLTKLQIRPLLALFSSLFFAALYAPAMYEQAVLTESLSLFSLVLVAWLVVELNLRISQETRITGLSMIAGAVIGCAILVRPENLIVALSICLINMLVALAILRTPVRTASARALVKSSAILILCAAPFVLGWMTVNFIGLGQFRLTTMTGWQRSQTVYNLWDKVEPADRVLGDILSRSYARRGEGNRGDRRDHFWLAYDELTTRNRDLPLDQYAKVAPNGGFSGWLYGLASETSRVYTHRFTAGASIRPTVTLQTPNNVGDYIGTVSRKLMIKYPGTWLRNAFTAFLETFNFRYWQPSDSHPVAVSGGSVIRVHMLWSFAKWMDVIEAPVLTVLYCVTLGLAIVGILVLRSSHPDNALGVAPVIALATGTLGTMAAYCLLAGYDIRYSAPHLGTIVIAGAFVFEKILKSFSRHQSAWVPTAP